MRTFIASCPTCDHFLGVMEKAGKLTVLADCKHTKRSMAAGIWEALAVPVSEQPDYRLVREYWPIKPGSPKKLN